MTTPSATQIARYGTIARVLSEALARKGLTHAEIGRKLKPDHSNPSAIVHPWLKATSAPNSEYRAKLVEILEVAEKDLIPKDLSNADKAISKVDKALANKMIGKSETAAKKKELKDVKETKQPETKAVVVQREKADPWQIPQPPRNKPLSFEITADGQSHITLDVTTTLEKGKALLRMLLEDASFSSD